MRTFSVAFIAVLFSLSATAREAPKLDKASLAGSWQGAMVVAMKGDTHTMPLTMKFTADGKVELSSPFEKTETQTWALDAKTRTLTFTDSKGSTDMVLADIALAVGGARGTTVSLKASMRPPNAGKMPPGMSVTLYAAKLP